MNQCQPSWRRNYFLSGDLVIAIIFRVNFWSERSKGKVAEREAGKILPHHLNESYSCLISVVSSWWAEEADGNKRAVPFITPSAPLPPLPKRKKIPLEPSEKHNEKFLMKIVFCFVCYCLVWVQISLHV